MVDASKRAVDPRQDSGRNSGGVKWQRVLGRPVIPGAQERRQVSIEAADRYAQGRA